MNCQTVIWPTQHRRGGKFQGMSAHAEESDILTNTWFNRHSMKKQGMINEIRFKSIFGLYLYPYVCVFTCNYSIFGFMTGTCVTPKSTGYSSLYCLGTLVKKLWRQNVWSNTRIMLHNFLYSPVAYIGLHKGWQSGTPIACSHVGSYYDLEKVYRSWKSLKSQTHPCTSGCIALIRAGQTSLQKRLCKA